MRILKEPESVCARSPPTDYSDKKLDVEKIDIKLDKKKGVLDKKDCA